MYWVSLAFAAALGAAGPAPAPLTTAQVVTPDGYDEPSFSPDGKRMAALALASGHEELAILARDGRLLKTLTDEPFDHEDPAWSPDGRWIAYVSMAGGGERIHIVHPDGSGDEALTPAGQKVIHPHWSRDGRSLFYCTDDDLKPPAKNDSDILALDLATRAVRQVVVGGVNTYPAPSPDGRRLAFRRMVEVANSEVWLARIDGADARNLTNDPSFDGWPDWSPDGRTLAFATNRDTDRQTYRVWLMDADGGRPRLLADTPGRATSPKWTPDGRWIYFPSCRRVNGKAGCTIYRAAAG